MNASPLPESPRSRGLFAAVRLTWQVGRLPMIAVLTLLEPVVRSVFTLAMLLGVAVAVAFELSAVGPTFPFLGMLAASLGFGLALIAYYGLLALVSH